jgi:hypothetical protein
VLANQQYSEVKVSNGGQLHHAVAVAHVCATSPAIVEHGVKQAEQGWPKQYMYDLLEPNPRWPY